MKVWNWEGFWSYFTNLYLLEGALWTIGLTISTLILGGLLGLVLAVMRLSKHKAVSRTAQGYVWIFRGTPLLVQLIIIYTGLPQLGLVRFTVLESAILGLALNEAAYLSEILRGGILSVAKGQTEAARALGLKPFQNFRLVVLPQALRVIIPPLGNSVNGLLKTTSDRKSTRLNSSHTVISYAVFCLKKKKKKIKNHLLKKKKKKTKQKI